MGKPFKPTDEEFKDLEPHISAGMSGWLDLHRQADKILDSLK